MSMGVRFTGGGGGAVMEGKPYEDVARLLESFDQFFGADNVGELHLFRLHLI